MKKVFLIISILLMTGIIMAQSRQRKDLRIYKDSPGVYLMGTGALLDFNQGDLVLTQSANTLTLSGGNLALGTNNLLLTGSIGATGTRVAKGWFTNLELTNLPTIAGASLSALYTSGDIAIGVNNLTLTGSIASTGSRVTKGWFTNLEVTNAPTVGGTSIFTTPLFSGNVGVGTTAVAYHKLSVIAAGGTNLNALNITNSDINKVRTTATTASDTSSVNVKFASSGSPTLTVLGKTGNTLFKVDTLNVVSGSALTVAGTDTTVAKAYGKIVFKTSDSTLYVCKYIRPTGKKCWFKLDN